MNELIQQLMTATAEASSRRLTYEMESAQRREDWEVENYLAAMEDKAFFDSGGNPPF